jgi:hypothetical protein
VASRDTEKFAGVAIPPYKTVIETVNGPSSYTTDGDTYRSANLRVIERAACLQGTNGWRGEVVTGSVTGNQFTLRIWTGTSQPGSGVDLSAQAFTLLLQGL